MWQLLVWAYSRELVRVTEGRIADYMPTYGGTSATAAVCRMLDTGLVGSGPVARVTRFPVHADAEWVHGLVRSLDRDEYWLIVNTAEAGAPPEWDPYCPPVTVEPMLKANGRPRMIVCPVAKRPVACRIQVTGMAPSKAEATRREARQRYGKWVQLLWALREMLLEQDGLSRWQVTGIGVEAEPWVKR